MKTYWIDFYMVAAVVMTALCGCVSEETVVGNGNGGTEEINKSTYATFSVTLTDPITKLNSDEDESDKITSIRILVYEGDKGLNSLCETDQVVMPTENKSATLQTTSGWKKVLVLANDYSKPWRLPSQVGKTLGDLVANKTESSGERLSAGEIDFGTPTIGKSAEILESINYSTITNPQSLVFSNTLADSSCRRFFKANIPSSESITGMNGEANNHFNIYLKRTVAKVTACFMGNTYPVPTTDSKGSVSNMCWGLRNLNRAVALFQVPHVSGKPQAPFFYELTSWNPDAMSTQISYQRYWWSKDKTGEINYPIAVGNTTLRSYYIPENANYITHPGNTSYLAIKATYTPTFNTVIKAANFNSLGILTSVDLGNIAGGTTFYRLAGVPGTNGEARLNLYGDGKFQSGSLFYNEEDIRRVAYMVEHLGSIAGYTDDYIPQTVRIDKYDKGLCYYRIDIKSNASDWVERNKAYLVSILSFTSIGDPSLSDVETVPSTTIKSAISIMPWDEVLISNK